MKSLRYRRALVTGLPHHARILARMGNRHSRQWRFITVGMSRLAAFRTLIELPRADAVLCVGGPGPGALIEGLARAWCKPVFVIWVGSDVTALRERTDEAALLPLRAIVNCADTPMLSAELDELGINAAPVKIAGVVPVHRPAAFPASFSVLTYLPEPRRRFYGSEHVYELAARFPEVAFSVIGRGGPEPQATANVRFLGHREDVDELIDRSTVMLRLTEHDGQSVMVNQALARGRYVIWTQPFPGVRTVTDAGSAADELRLLHERHAANALPFNEAGLSHIASDYTESAVVAALEARMGTPRPMPPARERHAAVSGDPRSAARACALLRAHGTQWDATPLETSSRIRTVTALCTLARSDLWFTAGTSSARPWYADGLFAAAAWLFGKTRTTGTPQELFAPADTVARDLEHVFDAACGPAHAAAPHEFAPFTRLALYLTDSVAVAAAAGLTLLFARDRRSASSAVAGAAAATVFSCAVLGSYTRSFAPDARNEAYSGVSAGALALAVFGLASAAPGARSNRLAGGATIAGAAVLATLLRVLLHGRLPLQPNAQRADATAGIAARCAKRVLDLVGALVIAPLVVPIGCIVALAIRRDDGGPIFFVQQRAGRDGKPFGIIKFRTMRCDSDGAWVVANDSRITRIGKFLRRTSLDELPQLINVLRGEMSLVGPRPEMVSYAEEFAMTMPRYAERGRVKPGITGWAQVMLPRHFGVDQAPNVLAHDLFYVDHCSLGLDCLILAKTAVEVLFHDAV